MTVLAAVASTIWNSVNRSPFAVGPKMPTTSVTTIAVARNPGRVAQAASGMIAHSRYQGCTTGNSSTVAPERDAEPADRMQPAAQHREQQPGDERPRSMNTPIARVSASTAVV